MPLELALAPLMLRATLDDHRRLTALGKSVTDAALSVMGARFVNQHEPRLHFLAVLLYYATLAASGLRSLGEELVDISPVTVSTRDRGLFAALAGRGVPVPHTVGVRPMGRGRGMLYAIGLALEGVALRMLATKLFPSHSRRAVDTALALGGTLFFIFGTYATIPSRLCGVRYLSLSPRFQASYKGANPYVGVGIILAVVQAAALVSAMWSAPGRTARSSPSDAASSATTSASDDDSSDESGPGAGQCMLCLGRRKVPTATACGHIYCWSCIGTWLQGQQACPLCRHPCHHSTLIPLIGYKAPPDGQ